MDNEEIYTLAECVDEYLGLRQIDKKKYFSSYLISAKYAWKYLFKNTIYAVQSQWFTVQAGAPYNYIPIPKGTVRVFSVTHVNKDGRMEDLFYDNLVNIVQKPLPTQKQCGCTTCQCGGLCEDISALTYTTKLLFTINGVNYYEKDWIKVCPNGEVIEYREVPVKKYNNYTGDGGDYSNDYMNDYLIGAPPFSDYTIVTENFQSIVCNLAVAPCGCPVDTPENVGIMNEFCGCYLPFNAYCKRHRHQKFLGEINPSHKKGTVKMSDCGTKMYYIPHKTHDNLPPHIPDFLLLNWQTSGENCNEVVQVPDYAKDAMFFGIDDYSIRFNKAYTKSERDDAKYAFINAQNQIIMFLNPINLERLSTIQDAEIRW